MSGKAQTSLGNRSYLIQVINGSFLESSGDQWQRWPMTAVTNDSGDQWQRWPMTAVTNDNGDQNIYIYWSGSLSMWIKSVWSFVTVYLPLEK